MSNIREFISGGGDIREAIDSEKSVTITELLRDLEKRVRDLECELYLLCDKKENLDG